MSNVCKKALHNIFVIMGFILLWILSPFLVTGQMLDPVSFSISKDTLMSGVVNELEVFAEIDNSWHLYSIHNDSGAGPIPTRFSSASELFMIAGDIRESEADIEFDPNFGKELGWHSGSAVFHVPVLTDPSLGTDQNQEVGILVHYQVCDDKSCLPPRTKEIVGDIYLTTSDIDSPGITFTGNDFGFGTGFESVRNDNEESKEPAEAEKRATSFFLLSLLAGLVVGMIIAYYRRKSKQNR